MTATPIVKPTMNPPTPHTPNEINPPDVYDVSRWRPVPPAEWLESLGEASCTLDEPADLKVEVTTLHDARVRTVHHAYVRTRDFAGTGDGIAPWLMTIYTPEGGKTVCFERTDVILCNS
jgi:hypothetical protein